MVLCALSFTDTILSYFEVEGSIISYLNALLVWLYVKDVIDDADAEEGYVFNRFYADCMFMNNPIDWDDVI